MGACSREQRANEKGFAGNGLAWFVCVPLELKRRAHMRPARGLRDTAHAAVSRGRCDPLGSEACWRAHGGLTRVLETHHRRTFGSPSSHTHALLVACAAPVACVGLAAFWRPAAGSRPVHPGAARPAWERAPRRILASLQSICAARRARLQQFRGARPPHCRFAAPGAAAACPRTRPARPAGREPISILIGLRQQGAAQSSAAMSAAGPPSTLSGQRPRAGRRLVSPMALPACATKLAGVCAAAPGAHQHTPPAPLGLCIAGSL